MSRHGSNLETGGGESLSLASALRGSLGSGALVVGSRGRFTVSTAETERLLGLSPGKGIDAPLVSLPAPLRKVIREACSAKRSPTPRNVTLRRAGGGPVTLHVTAVPVLEASNRTSVAVVLTDITGAARVEQLMGRLDRLANLGTLSASLAHEIKNALVAVRTFLDTLLEKNRDAELADLVQREIQRINAIVGQMLKYAGPARQAFSPVGVHSVLDHSLRMVQHQLDSKLISLHRAFGASPDAIKGDDYQLEQAFTNLFLNAIEAMGPNGSLSVATELIPGRPSPPGAAGRAKHVRIVIADTGIGIAPEAARRLFEPFFTTKPHGTGLGLPIARRILQEHRGDITVQTQVNKGTTFSILLPAHGTGG